MAYNVNSLTDDCYPNTLCLINKFDIRDEEERKLDEAIANAEQFFSEKPVSTDAYVE